MANNKMSKIQIEIPADLKIKIINKQTAIQEKSIDSTKRPSMNTVINIILEEYFKNNN